MGFNILAIDHGNYENKTYHAKFTNNFVQDTMVSPFWGEYIKYDGYYYYPSEEPSYFLKDKTENEGMLISTLYGIVIESKKGALNPDAPVYVAIGLPPSDISVYGQKYADYIRHYFGEELTFIYGAGDKEQTYKIRLADVYVFPQDYSAIVAYKPRNVGDKEIKPNELLKSLYIRQGKPSPYISIDIGGYTTDIVYYVNGKPIKNTSGSRESGVIRMAEHIVSRVMQRGITLNREKVISIISGEDNTMSDEINSIIHSEARMWARKILNEMRTAYAFDLSATIIIFVGGGSILLEKYLTEEVKAQRIKAKQDPNKGFTFIRDSHANAKGYHILASDRLKKLNG